MPGNRVTEEEVKFILDNCNEITVAEMARRLGRADKTVSEIIKKHGIKRTYFNRWTDVEDRFVRENYLAMSATEMAKILGRTESSTAARRFSLGLVGRKDVVRDTVRVVYGYVFKSVPGVSRKMTEHKAVAEEKIGRRLERNEVVHHINAMKADNRPENLHVCTNSEHSHAHQSVTRLIAPLIEMGIIWFDESDHKYKLADRPDGEN